MHQGTRLRRLALALAVPVAAIGGIPLTAQAASSSPLSAAKAAPTDVPGQPSGPGTPAPAPPSATGNPSATVGSPTGTPTSSATTSSAPTRTPPASAPGGPPSASVSAGTRAAVLNCANKTVPTPVTVKIGNVAGRQAVVDGDGCALYVNTQDRPQVTGVDPRGQATFPPAPGPGQAGQGVAQANLATFTRADGTIQLTYFGHQLYYSTQDTQPGQGNGQGVDRSWFLIDAAGTTITN